MTQPPVVTIAIVNYNSSDLLKSCLETLATTIHLPHDVVVVDNASADRGASAAKVVADFPGVRLIQRERNQYYSPAANQAWRAGLGEFVLFLGTDVTVRPGAVDELYAVLARGDQYGAAGCRLVRPDGETELVARSELTPSVYFCNFTLAGRLLPGLRRSVNEHLNYHGWDRQSSRDVASCSGSCLMIRRALLERFGGYDERFSLYFLEDDLASKIRASGKRIRFVGEVNCVHAGHATLKREVPSSIRAVWRRDARTYARLHFGSATAVAIAAAMGMTEAARSVRALLASFGLVSPPPGWWTVPGQ